MPTTTTKKKPRRKYAHPRTGHALPSVTTLIGQIDKSGPLTWWAARLAAETTAAALLDGGLPRAQAIDLGRRAHDKAKRAAADRGTLAHALVEAHYTGEPAEVEDADPVELAAAEACAARAIEAIDALGTVECSELGGVACLDHRWYGGTMDFAIRLHADDSTLILGDLKTGKDVYPEVAIQLAAYAHLLWHTTGQLVHSGLVVHAPAYDDAHGQPRPVQIHRISEQRMIAGLSVFRALLQLHGARGALDEADADIGAEMLRMGVT
jgi:hypothetical protein